MALSMDFKMIRGDEMHFVMWRVLPDRRSRSTALSDAPGHGYFAQHTSHGIRRVNPLWKKQAAIGLAIATRCRNDGGSAAMARMAHIPGCKQKRSKS